MRGKKLSEGEINQIVYFRDEDKLTFREIAEKLGVSQSAVQRLYRKWSKEPGSEERPLSDEVERTVKKLGAFKHTVLSDITDLYKKIDYVLKRITQFNRRLKDANFITRDESNKGMDMLMKETVKMLEGVCERLDNLENPPKSKLVDSVSAKNRQLLREKEDLQHENKRLVRALIGREQDREIEGQLEAIKKKGGFRKIFGL